MSPTATGGTDVHEEGLIIPQLETSTVAHYRMGRVYTRAAWHNCVKFCHPDYPMRMCMYVILTGSCLFISYCSVDPENTHPPAPQVKEQSSSPEDRKPPPAAPTLLTTSNTAPATDNTVEPQALSSSPTAAKGCSRSVSKSRSKSRSPSPSPRFQPHYIEQQGFIQSPTCGSLLSSAQKSK